MESKANYYERATAWHYVGLFFGVMFAISGLVLGFAFGQSEYNSIGESFKKKDELRAQCVAGNDRACSIYEVDYGR